MGTVWTNFLLGFGAAILNTPHCLGMCGGFPLHLAKSSKNRLAPARQLLFVAGKTCTYMFLGALAASLGIILFSNTVLIKAAPMLRIGAGFITLLFGLLMLGFRLPSVKALQGIADSGLVQGLLGGLFVNPNPAAALVLGLGAGFLPCPLPMGMLAICATSHSVVQGMLLMTGVGLGTAPGLLAVGIFGIGLDRKFARVGMRAAGLAVVIIALITIGRSSGIIAKPHSAGHSTMPSCCGGDPR